MLIVYFRHSSKNKEINTNLSVLISCVNVIGYTICKKFSDYLISFTPAAIFAAILFIRAIWAVVISELAFENFSVNS